MVFVKETFNDDENLNLGIIICNCKEEIHQNMWIFCLWQKAEILHTQIFKVHNLGFCNLVFEFLIQSIYCKA